LWTEGQLHVTLYQVGHILKDRKHLEILTAVMK